MDPVLGAESLGPERGRHHRDPLGECLEHLQPGAAPETEGHHHQVGAGQLVARCRGPGRRWTPRVGRRARRAPGRSSRPGGPHVGDERHAAAVATSRRPGSGPPRRSAGSAGSREEDRRGRPTSSRPTGSSTAPVAVGHHRDPRHPFRPARSASSSLHTTVAVTPLRPADAGAPTDEPPPRRSARLPRRRARRPGPAGVGRDGQSGGDLASSRSTRSSTRGRPPGGPRPAPRTDAEIPDEVVGATVKRATDGPPGAGPAGGTRMGSPSGPGGPAAPVRRRPIVDPIRPTRPRPSASSGGSISVRPCGTIEKTRSDRTDRAREDGRQPEPRAAVVRPRVLAGDHQGPHARPIRSGPGLGSPPTQWAGVLPQPGHGSRPARHRGRPRRLPVTRRPGGEPGYDPVAGRAGTGEPGMTEIWQPTTEPLVLHVIPTPVARGAQREARALADQLDAPGVRAHRLLTLFDGPVEVAARPLPHVDGGRSPAVGYDLRVVPKLLRRAQAARPGAGGGPRQRPAQVPGPRPGRHPAAPRLLRHRHLRRLRGPAAPAARCGSGWWPGPTWSRPRGTRSSSNAPSCSGCRRPGDDDPERPGS